jgi:hypothetical protein
MEGFNRTEKELRLANASHVYAGNAMQSTNSSIGTARSRALLSTESLSCATALIWNLAVWLNGVE